MNLMHIKTTLGTNKIWSLYTGGVNKKSSIICRMTYPQSIFAGSLEWSGVNGTFVFEAKKTYY